MATKMDLMFEEYKILENRYRGDTNRIWTQSQILIAANAIIINAVVAVISNTDKVWAVNPALVIIAIALVGFAACLAWFFGLANESAYRREVLSLLREMETELNLPMHVFSKVGERQKDFRLWQRVGGGRALVGLSFVFVIAWIIVGVIGFMLINSSSCSR